ncbi:hypothetical protein MtrunA17_Chr8g0348731 [Medicago truncatula]|uniref:Uncharacterized protein n=1 Tax=Medicago truncatula TaxID=3880 RepID=A0A396GEX2_MEDTR|nr:hypothetical protein MtrunA17_Chr8g0348731 [Medicago truncatula]
MRMFNATPHEQRRQWVASLLGKQEIKSFIVLKGHMDFIQQVHAITLQHQPPSKSKCCR